MGPNPLRNPKENPFRFTRQSKIDGALVPNHSLNELLRTSFNIEAPPLDEDSANQEWPHIGDYLAAFRSAVASHSRWEVQDRCILGAFGFQKIAMWQDLGRNEQRIAQHPVCRAIGGDSESLRQSDGLNTKTELDEAVPPHSTFHILDCDSSQQLAIEAAKAGSHLVLDGPPGTGKSQTIANIIAECLANGQTVLFVSEKLAALNVVKSRLDNANLGDFCLEVHSHKKSKKDVIAELSASLKLSVERAESQDRQLSALYSLRRELNAYARSLHQRRSALNRSAYHLHGRLAAVFNAPTTRCPVRGAFEIDAAQLDRTCQVIESIARFEGVLCAQDVHPWRSCKLDAWSMSAEDDIQYHFPRLADLLEKRAEGFRGLISLGFMSPDPKLADFGAAIEEGCRAAAHPKIPAAWFCDDPRRVAGSYQKIHACAVRLQELRRALPAFRPDAFARHDPALAERIATKDDSLDRLVPHSFTGARALGKHLGSVAEQLRA